MIALTTAFALLASGSTAPVNPNARVPYLEEADEETTDLLDGETEGLEIDELVFEDDIPEQMGDLEGDESESQ